MKRKLILLIVLIACFVVTGCGSNGKSGSNSYITYYKDSKILSKLSEKEIEPGLKYKEVSWKENDNLVVAIIVYNNTDKNHIINGSIQGYKGNSQNNQVAQSDTETILPHSAYPLAFTLLDADSYKIERLEIYGENDDAIKEEEYKFDSYKKDEEKSLLYLYYKYNGNKSNNSEVEIYGTKDGKIVGKFTSYLYVADEDGDESNDSPSKSGEKCVAKFGYPKTLDFSKYDGFIYFYHGYND